MIKSRKISALACTIFLMYMLLLFWIISLKCNMEITISDTQIMNAGTTLSERFRTHLSYKIFYVDLKDTLVNIILFLPLGMVLPFLMKKRVYLNSIFLGALISVAFEVFQIISCIGMFTYGDIIYNTIGVILGATIYVILIKTADEKRLSTAFIIHILILIPVLNYAAVNTAKNIHLYI